MALSIIATAPPGANQKGPHTMTAATYVKPIASIIRAPEMRWDEPNQIEKNNAARKAEAARRAAMRDLVSQFRR